jgi:transposase
MGRESREIWTKRVARWQASGLSAKEFASELGISAATLQHWAWRLRQGKVSKSEAAVSSRPSLQVVEVVAAEPVTQRSEAAEPYEVMTPAGLRVRIPRNFDRESLRRLLSAVLS